MSEQYPPPPSNEPTGSGATPPPPGGPYGAAPPPENPYGAPPPAPAYGAPAPAGPVTRPPAMDQAVLLMRIGAVLSLLSLVSAFFVGDGVRETVEQSLRDSGQTVDQSTVDAAVAVGIGVGVVFGLVGAGLWLFMAWANGRGKSWARILSTVFFGLSLVGFLINLAQPQGILSRILGVVGVLLGAYIVFLLWKKESSEFYAASSAPRY